MGLPRIAKDPAARLDYGIDWRVNGWLEPGETITSSVWIVPDGLTASSESVVAGTATVVWLEGGEAGKSYRVTNEITTSKNGRRDRRSFDVSVSIR